MSKLQRFMFNTGVQVNAHTPPVAVTPGNVVRDGILQIPFYCEDVPNGAVFMFACDSVPPGCEHLLVREMHNTNLLSKYAFFQVRE